MGLRNRVTNLEEEVRGIRRSANNLCITIPLGDGYFSAFKLSVVLDALLDHLGVVGRTQGQLILVKREPLALTATEASAKKK